MNKMPRQFHGVAMRASKVVFLFASLLFPGASIAAPKTPADIHFTSAVSACNYFAEHPKQMNLERFEEYELPRYLLGQEEPSILTSTEVVDRIFDPRTKGAVLKACDAMFGALAKKSAEKFTDPKVIGPRGDVALKDCLTRVPRDANFGTQYFEADLVDFQTARTRMSVSYPALSAVHSTVAHGSLPADTTYGVLFDACDKKLSAAVAASKDREAKHTKHDREMYAKEAATDAADDKKWLSRLKGDKLKLYKGWNHAPPDNEAESSVWTYHLFGGDAYRCEYTYSFKGDVMVGRSHSDDVGCSHLTPPY